jgi:quercetin dioxygenase-like cupin family protein
MKAGVKGSPHKHENCEHAWYVLSGKGTYYLDGKAFRFEPGMVLFAPNNMMHSIDVDPEQDATYVVIYSPPGPEQLLKTKGANAFSK